MTSQLSGGDFEVTIPSLTDDADIVEAFRLYHYGLTVEPTEGTPITNTSIEYHLQNLANDIATLQAGAAQITALTTENLNDITTTSTYSQSSTPSSGLNYPALYPGLLIVNAISGGAIYQTYQTVGGTAGQNNRWWRGRSATAADWGSWKKASDVTHNHDERYYTETEIDAKIAPAASLTASTVPVLDATKKITSSSVTSTELGYLSGVDSSIQDQLDDRYTKSETVRVFVQSSQPTGASTGDLWIW